jgi:hypothetical protein
VRSTKHLESMEIDEARVGRRSMRRVGRRSMRRESRDWSTKLGIGGDGDGSERRVAMTMKKESEGSHVATLILDA